MTTINATNKPFMIEKWRVYEAYKAVKKYGLAAFYRGWFETIRASSCTGKSAWMVRLPDGSGVNREAHAPF